MHSINNIMKLTLSNHEMIEEENLRNPELIFILSGTGQLEINGEKELFHGEDYFMVNVCESYCFSMKRQGMFARIEINYDIAKNYLNLNEYEFHCNSEEDSYENSSKMRRILKQICNQHLKQGAIDTIHLNALFWELLYFLSISYLERQKDTAAGSETEEKKRLETIKRFIEDHYMEDITLSTLADQMYCTEAYLSKYIKKKLGKNFKTLLTETRLEHAREQVAETDKTFMRIAMQNGFPSVAAFNKSFKENYKSTPSEYRMQVKKQEADRAERKTENTELSAELQRLLEQSETNLPFNAPLKSSISVNVSDAEQLQKYWCRLINGGRAINLLRGDMQQHIIRLQKELQFDYIRFWDIYDPDILLDMKKDNGAYNFSKLDIIIDFLRENHLHPYIELGFKPVRLMRSLNDYVEWRSGEEAFETRDEFKNFLDQMLRHFVNRYGIEEVEHWYFEQWRNPKDDRLESYFEEFEIIYSQIKAISHHIKVGGGGFNRNEGVSLERIIDAWSRRCCHPDFISIYSYPYLCDSSCVEDLITSKDINNYKAYSKDPEYMKNYLKYARQVMNNHGFWNQELHVTEWSFTISNRNVFNDSIFKGAYVVKNLADIVGQADMVGYWFNSDLVSEHYDTKNLLNGGCGLLSKNGICKPAFYGLDFMNRLGACLLGKNKHCIITTNRHDTYSILCHHFVQPNYKYFMEAENSIQVSELSQYFDGESCRLHISIQGVKNGTYDIKKRMVNKNYGSVQDEWIKMGLSDNLNLQDIEYLRQVCVPHISMEPYQVTNHVLEIETVLQLNEIQHIHVLYRL